MSLEELRKAFSELLREEKSKKEVKKVKRARRKKVSEVRGVGGDETPTEVYRTIYFMLTGKTIRGGKKKAVLAIMDELSKRLKKL